MLDGSVGKQILGSTEPYWFRGLAYFDSGARSFYTVNKQIRTPEDHERTEDPCAKEPDSRGDDEDIRWFGYSRGLGVNCIRPYKVMSWMEPRIIRLP